MAKHVPKLSGTGEGLPGKLMKSDRLKNWVFLMKLLVISNFLYTLFVPEHVGIEVPFVILPYIFFMKSLPYKVKSRVFVSLPGHNNSKYCNIFI